MDLLVLRVNSLEQNLNIIIPHFDKYPLLTQKYSDYLLFKNVVMMMSRGEHLTTEGVETIVNMRASLNNGLSLVLKKAFPNYTSITRPLVEDNPEFHPQWIAFTSGDGSFMVSVVKKVGSKVGYLVTLSFRLIQHSRDENLMKNFPSYLGCGKYYLHSVRNYGDFRVEKFSDISEKIMPFFLQYKIMVTKAADFQYWCRVVELMKTKEHLTPQGIDEIKQIKAGINTGRT